MGRGKGSGSKKMSSKRARDETEEDAAINTHPDYNDDTKWVHKDDYDQKMEEIDDLEATVKELENNVNQLEQKIENANEHKRLAKEQANFEKNQKTAAEKRVKNLEKNVSGLERKIRDLENNKKSLNRAEIENKELKRDKKILERELKEAKDTISSLRKQLENIDKEKQKQDHQLEMERERTNREAIKKQKEVETQNQKFHQKQTLLVMQQNAKQQMESDKRAAKSKKIQMRSQMIQSFQGGAGTQFNQHGPPQNQIYYGHGPNPISSNNPFVSDVGHLAPSMGFQQHPFSHYNSAVAGPASYGGPQQLGYGSQQLQSNGHLPPPGVPTAAPFQVQSYPLAPVAAPPAPMAPIAAQGNTNQGPGITQDQVTQSYATGSVAAQPSHVPNEITPDQSAVSRQQTANQGQDPLALDLENIFNHA